MTRRLPLSQLDVWGEASGMAFRHAYQQHGDPCDCPPDDQRRWRGRRRLRRLSRAWDRFLAWVEWQVGR